MFSAEGICENRQTSVQLVVKYWLNRVIYGKLPLHYHIQSICLNIGNNVTPIGNNVIPSVELLFTDIV